MSELDRYSLRWRALDRPWLASQWQRLEALAQPDIFLSWDWMSVWLDTMQPSAQVLEVCCGEDVIGLGIFTLRTETRHRLLRSRVLRLAQTGVIEQDQIWIEYNDLLWHPDHAEVGPAAVMRFLLAQPGWDEFQLGATRAQRQTAYAHPDLASVERWCAPTFGVDLAALRQQGRGYLASLSRNTRHQINRSERLYAERGELTLHIETEAELMLARWPELAAMHQQRWGEQSGFVNPQFVQFHQALIRQAAAQGHAEFVILTCHESVLGILYNFTYRGRVYFYLSGLCYEEDRRLKPGLVLHARAIQHYLDQGFAGYDFMGGEARYKRSLGACEGDLTVISYQRARLGLRAEQWARRVKQAWRSAGAEHINQQEHHE